MTRHMRPRALSPACSLLAGLLLFQARAWAVEAPPGRSIAPVETSAAGAGPAELQALQRRLDAVNEMASQLADQQAQGLSRNAEALARVNDSLNDLQGAQSRSQASLDGVEQRLKDLAGRLQAVEQAQARSGSDAAVLGGRMDALDKGQAALRARLDDGDQQLKDALKVLDASRVEMAARGEKLVTLTDLLSVMKQDLDNDHEELVELKQTLKRYEPAADAPEAGSWLDRALRWPYLPAVAVGLSAVAVGVAASK